MPKPTTAAEKPRHAETVSASPPPQPVEPESDASETTFVPPPPPPAPRPMAEVLAPPPPKAAPPRPETTSRALPDAAPVAVATTAPVVAASPPHPPPATNAASALATVAPSAGVPSRASSEMPQWEDEVLARLERFKRYPRRAQLRRQEGVAYIRFTIDRHGEVSAAALQRSSGIDALDDETLALVERARPFPAPPADFGRDSIELVVPIRYVLR